MNRPVQMSRARDWRMQQSPAYDPQHSQQYVGESSKYLLFTLI